ncbi:hypothetical protein NE237_007511 [Protea cynaroides]|uniref:Uncharacterized protein n=1 Tax=Protea cynaroides TaxID=273540 RepID=A0A9Q0QWG9_9MAGN|nr:hypothetical protein NE237_007511 [Protea cynaroides]
MGHDSLVSQDGRDCFERLNRLLCWSLFSRHASGGTCLGLGLDDEGGHSSLACGWRGLLGVLRRDKGRVFGWRWDGLHVRGFRKTQEGGPQGDRQSFEIADALRSGDVRSFSDWLILLLLSFTLPKFEASNGDAVRVRVGFRDSVSSFYSIKRKKSSVSSGLIPADSIPKKFIRALNFRGGLLHP